MARIYDLVEDRLVQRVGSDKVTAQKGGCPFGRKGLNLEMG